VMAMKSPRFADESGGRADGFFFAIGLGKLDGIRAASNDLQCRLHGG